MAKNIIILGPFTSGTNLIKKIFFKHNIIHNENGYWKHSIDVQQLKKTCENKNTLVVIMYRNIYNWLNSINDSKYLFEFTNFESEAYFDTYKNYNKRTKYNNIIDLYNNYYLNYIDLIQNYENVIFYDYKKIINNNSLLYINNKLKKFNIKPVDNITFLNSLSKPSKNHGHCVKNAKEQNDVYWDNINKIKKILDNSDVKKYINDDIINFFEC